MNKTFFRENRDYLLFVLAAVFWGLGEGMYIYYQTIYMEQLGAQPVLIGAWFSLIGVVQMLIQTPAGYLTDRYGRRPLLSIGWLLAVSSVWIFFLAENITVFLIGIFVNGLMAIGWPAQYSYIAASTQKMSPSRALTLMMAFTFTGNALGTFISSQINQFYGIRNVYLFAAISVTISALFILLLHPQMVVKIPEFHQKRSILKNRQFLFFLGILIVVSMGITLPYLLASNYMQNFIGLDLGVIGSLGVIAGIGNVVVLLIVGNFRPNVAFLIGQALLASFAGILWLGKSMELFYVAYFCLGGIWLTKTIAVVLVKTMVRDVEVGLAIGMTETVKALAMVAASFSAGVLYQMSPEKTYSVSLGFISVGFMLTLIFFALQNKSPLLFNKTHLPDRGIT
jgi:MFS family permease